MARNNNLAPGIQIIQGDCLEILPTLEADSVDAIITDPPYFKVKNEPWDNQWDNPIKFLEWIGILCEQFQRILKPSGSLYFFAYPKMAARVECKIGEWFNVLNSIVWRKGLTGKTSTGLFKRCEKESLRTWLPITERIIFAEHFGSDSFAKGEAGYERKCDELRGFIFEPLRAYLASEWKRAGLKFEQANDACGTASMAGRHFFSKSQWCFPTAEHYASLQRYANCNGGKYLRREYEDLRCEYEDLRRPFNVAARDQWSDVWDFDPVQYYPGKHPCEKPLLLLCHILKVSTKPGAVVFDPFAGSASLGHACCRLGRNFIGIEIDHDYCEIARRRLEQELAQGGLDLTG